MNRARIPLFALALLVLAWIWQWKFHLPELPEQVATHFSFSGKADGWSSADSFRRVYFWLQAGITIPMLAFALLIPPLARSGKLELPKRESPEEEEADRDFLSSQLLWITTLTFALNLQIHQLILRCNLDGTYQLGPSSWIAMGLYLGCLGLLTRKIWQRSRPS
ncbi:MAG: DUF1648 domain-containing protein [Candidatus Krumholzibacteria bacterium]|jgi:uncharacterized membrane protein|nr:DUF1648 domain-containing protein [Candidatus Krumholzibacteria bacterium]MDP7022265.1 DUF1648 domain-containing protein [Candidatus Krumholzibacteria bacterium]